jgi:hypothetical protein
MEKSREAYVSSKITILLQSIAREFQCTKSPNWKDLGTKSSPPHAAVETHFRSEEANLIQFSIFARFLSSLSTSIRTSSNSLSLTLPHTIAPTLVRPYSCVCRNEIEEKGMKIKYIAVDFFYFLLFMLISLLAAAAAAANGHKAAHTKKFSSCFTFFSLSLLL